MIIKGVKTKGWDRYAHEAVFGSVSSMKQIQAILSQDQNVPSEIEDLVDFKWQTSKGVFLHTLRVAMVYTMWQRNLDRMIENKYNTDSLGALHEMKRCAPDGVFTDLSNPIHCRLYRMCPWCRYRKTLEMLERMGKHLKQAKRIAVTQFSSYALMADMDLEGNRKVIEATCKKQNHWLGDFVITLPVWLQDTFYNNQWSSSYLSAWETSIIAFDDGSAPLILPENSITPKARKKHGMYFSSGGGWVVWENNTKKSLSEALKLVTGYPLYLLSKELDPIESPFVLDNANQLRAVGHGILR